MSLCRYYFIDSRGNILRKCRAAYCTICTLRLSLGPSLDNADIIKETWKKISFTEEVLAVPIAYRELSAEQYPKSFY